MLLMKMPRYLLFLVIIGLATVLAQNYPGYDDGSGEGMHMKWMADSQLTVYFNGDKVLSVMKSASVISTAFVPGPIPVGSVVAVDAMDTDGSLYMLLGEFRVVNGPTYVTNPNSWRCISATSPPDNWNTQGYDDSQWPLAQSLGKNDASSDYYYATTKGYSQDVNSAAHYIWANGAAEMSRVYCRWVVNNLPYAEIAVQSPSSFRVYWNDRSIMHGYDDLQTYVHIHKSVYAGDVIGFHAARTPGSDRVGVRAAVLWHCGEQTIRTNDAWLCSSIRPKDNWLSRNYVFDPNYWLPAVEVKDTSSTPVPSNNAALGKASYIWAMADATNPKSTDLASEVWCRYQLDGHGSLTGQLLSSTQGSWHHMSADTNTFTEQIPLQSDGRAMSVSYSGVNLGDVIGLRVQNTIGGALTGKTGGGSGFVIAQFTWMCQTYVTNQAWNCRKGDVDGTEPLNYRSVYLDEVSTADQEYINDVNRARWQPAHTIYSNSQRKVSYSWMTPSAAFNNQAKFIWDNTTLGSNKFSYCRYTLGSVSRPEEVASVSIFTPPAESAWQCLDYSNDKSRYSIPIRQNVNGDAECLSTAASTCIQATNQTDCAQMVLNPPAEAVSILACGDMHRQLYATTGYDDSTHWCYVARRLLSTQMPTIVAPSSSLSQLSSLGTTTTSIVTATVNATVSSNSTSTANSTATVTLPSTSTNATSTATATATSI